MKEINNKKHENAKEPNFYQSSECQSFVYTISLCLTISLGGFSFSYNSGLFTEVLNFFQIYFHWSKPDFVFFESVLSSSFVLGGVFGVIIFWFQLNYFGRRQNIIIIDIVNIIGAVLTLIPNINLMIIGRFITGYSAGSNSIIIPTFVKEISTNDCRGLMLGIHDVMMGLGLFFSYIMAIGLPIPGQESIMESNWWQIMFSVGLFIPILRIILFKTIYEVESPLSLLKQGKEIEAIESLKLFVQPSYLNKYKRQLYSEFESSKLDDEFSFFQLFSSSFRKQLLIGVLLMSSAQLVGIDAIIFYSHQIFKGNYSLNVARILLVLWALTKIISSIFTSGLVDKIGRKPIVLFGCSGISIVLAFLYYSTKYNLFYMKMTLLFIYIITFCFSFGPISATIVPEILPDKGVAFVMVIKWISSFCIVLIYPYLVNNLLSSTTETNLGEARSYLIFLLFSLLTFFLVFFILPETSNKPISKMNLAQNESSYDEISSYNQSIDEHIHHKIDKEINEIKKN